MIVPITRKEKLLNAIATNGNVDFVPKTREELFLFKILGADVNTPTPITRKELLYQHIIDGTIPTFEPRTRLEKFIMVAAGAELELPVVLTREEYWWAEISDSAYETITGAIVHFISKRARAIKSLIANISYTQDLNGYSYPWPAGGGKNLFDESTIYHGYYAPDIIDRMMLDEAYRTCVLTLPAGTYTFSCDMANIYILRYAIGEQNTSVTNEQSTVTFTVPSEDVVKICFRNTGTTAITGTFHTQIESGSTATSYTPYSNICPISGRTGANVTRTGKNLVDISSPEKDGYYNTNGTYSPANGYSCFLLPCTPDTYYTTSGDFAGIKTYWDAGLNFISGINQGGGATKTFKTPADAFFFRISIAKTKIDGTQQIELGSTATAYEPYAGNTYNVTFPAVGKNLFNAFDVQTSTTNGVTYYRTNGVYHLSGTNTKTGTTWVLDAQQTNLPNFEIGKTYTMSVSGNIPSNIYIQLNGANAQTAKQYSMGTVQRTSTQVSFTVDDRYSSTAQLFVGISGNATNVDGEFSVQIEEGSTATAYEPYTTTVYGGTVDLVSGLLTINRTTVNTTWGSGTNATNLGHVTRKRYNLNNPSKNYYTDAENDLKSNVIGQYDTLYSGDYVHMYLASTTHIWAYMPSNTAADTVMQFSYTLETPVTYQLTPTEVTTLLGDNTIWADTGDVSVTY